MYVTGRSSVIPSGGFRPPYVAKIGKAHRSHARKDGKKTEGQKTEGHRKKRESPRSLRTKFRSLSVSVRCQRPRTTNGQGDGIARKKKKHPSLSLSNVFYILKNMLYFFIEGLRRLSSGGAKRLSDQATGRDGDPRQKTRRSTGRRMPEEATGNTRKV